VNRILFPYHLACEESAVKSVRASETNTAGSERILCAMADKSDPRMPSAARPYVPALVDPNDLPPDYSSILAIIFGIAGVMMRQKAASFLSLVFIAQALANMKNYENDLKQIVMALTFAVMGLITNYLGPGPKVAAGST
jgi:hypothetical protein